MCFKPVSKSILSTFMGICLCQTHCCHSLIVILDCRNICKYANFKWLLTRTCDQEFIVGYKSRDFHLNRAMVQIELVYPYYYPSCSSKITTPRYIHNPELQPLPAHTMLRKAYLSVRYTEITS